MAEERARAEVKYERAPSRHVAIVSRLAHISVLTRGVQDEFDPLLVVLRDGLDDLSEKDRESYTGSLATIEDTAGRYDAAERLIRGIPGTQARDEAWSDQGLILARAGRIDLAVRETRRISDAKVRDKALQILFLGLARDGRPDLLRQVVQRLGVALEANGFVTRYVALAEANSGNDVEARRLAATLDGAVRIFVLGEIAEYELERQKSEQALMTLRELHATVAQARSPDGLRGNIGLNVVQAFAQTGAPSEGLDLVAYVSPDMQSSALLSLIEAQAHAGQIDAALSTTRRITDARDRDIALSDVGAARIVAGESADQALSELHYPGMRTLGECTAARWLASQGHLDKAGQLLRDAIPDAPLPTDPPDVNAGADLGDVVFVAADLGLFADALAIADRLPHGVPQVLCLDHILKAQAARGLKLDAVRTLALAVAAAQPKQRDVDVVLRHAAAVGLAAEALQTARLETDQIARDVTLRDLVEPLARQGQLEDAFAVAAGVKYYSSGAFVKLFEVLSEKPVG